MKLKLGSSQNEKIYECGYVHQPGIAEKANPMRLLQKGMGGATTVDGNPDLGKSAITIFYQSHLHPLSIIKYPTSTPGWETCGDAVFVGFTNKVGAGLSSTDGTVSLNNQPIAYSGFGTYFHGFPSSERGMKRVGITSSDGDSITVEVSPIEPIRLTAINGKTPAEADPIDGTKDVVIQLENGSADPESQIHVQFICKLVGTKIIYDVFVSAAKDEITIPKEAFKNFEGSPSPFIQNNTLIVMRVKENFIKGSDAGALRTVQTFMDWTPIEVIGDLSKGNMLTMGFDTSKNTNITAQWTLKSGYNIETQKDGPFTSPPVSLMEKAVVGSFVVRAKTDDTKVTTYNGWINTTRKWFPELSDQTWQNISNHLYDQFMEQVASNTSVSWLSIQDVVKSASQNDIYPLTSTDKTSFVEAGAYGSKRILSTRSKDVFSDMQITFPSDLPSSKIMSELSVNAVWAVTIDLNFDFETEALHPIVKMVAFAPNVSHKTPSRYFEITASTQAIPLKDVRNITGGAEAAILKMIKANQLWESLNLSLKKLQEFEQTIPAYQTIWSAK